MVAFDPAEVRAKAPGELRAESARQAPTAAITLGGHVSLGDYHYDRFGTPTNADLVGRVADLVETLGRPVATPEQPRDPENRTRPKLSTSREVVAARSSM